MKYWKYCSISCKTSGFSKKYILNKTLRMRLVVLYKYMNCTVDKTTSSATGDTTTYTNYITKYITSILLLIFWYYLLAPVVNFWKQTHLGRYVPAALEQSLFYQMLTLIADLCLLLLKLKMSITLSNWDFIWKYKRYARKSQNYGTTNKSWKP